MKTLTTFPQLFIALFILNLAACAPVEVKDALENQAPKVKIVDQKLTRLDFERVNLNFGIQVKNPNPVGLTLAGIDYDLKLAGHSFATGKQSKRLQLAAAGKSQFDLPLSLAFAEIYQGIKALEGKSEIPYELNTGLMIDVPLLGKMRYPVTTKGVMPLPRLPKIAVKNLSLDKMSFTSATLTLDIELDNPNAFGLLLQDLDYHFSVNNKRWATARAVELGKLKAEQTNRISLPINLNFMALGSSLYGLLKEGGDLNYRLGGELTAKSDHPLIGHFTVPVANRGQIALSR